jgi:hypothetical protein
MGTSSVDASVPHNWQVALLPRHTPVTEKVFRSHLLFCQRVGPAFAGSIFAANMSVCGGKMSFFEPSLWLCV